MGNMPRPVQDTEDTDILNMPGESVTPVRRQAHNS